MRTLTRALDQMQCAFAALREKYHARDNLRQEREFLPAALEIQATPPSPIGRAILWSILLFTGTAVAWASLGRIDIVAIAPGKLIPAGYSKVIQPLETATVQAIQVQDGQRVEAGQTLIELDSRITEADLKRLQEEQRRAEAEHQRLQRLARWSEQQQQPPPEDSDDLLRARIQEQRARLHALQSERGKIEAERDAIRKQVEKLKAILPIVSRRAQGLEQLSEQKMAAESQYLELEQQRLETQHDLYAQEQKVEELERSVQEVEARIEHAQKAFRKQTLEQLQEAEAKLNAANQELQKADTRHRAMTLTAPVAGRAQQLAVHSTGAVVTPAQALMVIVPGQRQLEVEAQLLNKDIGFVREGQPAEIKIDAFNFTRYGVIPAQVTGISDDAVPDEKQGWVYKVRIAPERTHIDIKGKKVELTPGMTVTAEIKTGDRRIIEYFLSPLLKGLDESVGER